MSKLLEKVVYSRIYDFLTENDLIFKSQYGFRKKHSCEHAVTELVGEICKGLENGKHTIALFLDLSKAFDSIMHSILFEKLERYGIRGVALDWFKSYLSSRLIRSKCHAASTDGVCFSDNHEINIGCPQGSCLGPLIFLVYCNDLYMNLELCKGILFADDMTLYKSHENLRYLQWCIKNDLEILSDWFKANRLSLNVNKLVGILFSKNKEKLDKIETSDLTIKFVESTKFLGIWIDEKLSWNTHIEKVIGKMRKNMNMLKLGKNFLTQHCKKLIYFAQIQSHLNYGLCIWGNMISTSKMNKLQSCQNKCMDLIKGKHADPKMYSLLGILKVKDLLKLENQKFGYKLYHELLPTRVIELCCSDQYGMNLEKCHKYNTRKKNILNKPKARNKLYRSCVIFKAMDSIDTLRGKTLNKKTMHSFAEHCKKLLLQNYD